MVILVMVEMGVKVISGTVFTNRKLKKPWTKIVKGLINKN